MVTDAPTTVGPTCFCTRELLPLCCKRKRYQNKCLAKCHGMDDKIDCSPHRVGMGSCDNPAVLLDDDPDTPSWYEANIWHMVIGAGTLVVLAILLNLGMRYLRRRKRKLRNEARRANQQPASQSEEDIEKGLSDKDDWSDSDEKFDNLWKDVSLEDLKRYKADNSKNDHLMARRNKF